MAQMNLSMKQQQTHRHREQTCGCQGGGGWEREGLGVWHTEWSKSEREKQIPYDITYMWNLKYGTNEPIYKTITFRMDKQQGPIV